MTKAVLPIKFTYEDYKNLPESETKRYELLEGELVMVPAPNWFHQSIAASLFKLLTQFVEERALGEVRFAPLDVVLSEHNVLQPDLLYLARERLSLVREGVLQGAPDLIVEILSPATSERDRTYKKTLYARHGVKEYWLVDPEAQTIEVLALGKRGYERLSLYTKGQTLESSLLAGLKIPLAEVF
jgi:Uma2 family endonuclease